MSPFSARLVLVTRRFWPLVGGAETVMANLAAELAARGVGVTLLTARWQNDWPAELTYRGVPVVRLPNPALRGWGTWRYMKAIDRWLRENRDSCDLVYVSMLKHDAYAALGAVAGSRPVVLRAEGAGPTGDCTWQREANFGRRIKRRCMTADALVGSSQTVQEELIGAGYPNDRIHYLPNGVPVPEKPNADDKAAARRALAEIDPALALPDNGPLALYTGRLHEAKGLDDLLEAWEVVTARRPDARLWLAGEGPHRGAVAQQIQARNLSGRVVLAGVFDHVDQLLAAADLFVLPSWEENMSMSLLEAMAAGVPIVASDIPGNRSVAVDGEHGLLVPPKRAEPLAAAIGRLLDEPELAGRLATAARDRVDERFSVAAMADRHLELFETLLASKTR